MLPVINNNWQTLGCQGDQKQLTATSSEQDFNLSGIHSHWKKRPHSKRCQNFVGVLHFVGHFEANIFSQLAKSIGFLTVK